MRSLGNLGIALIALGAGFVVLFLFFAVLGAFSPTETIVASLVATVLAVAFAVHLYRVRHALTREGGTDLHRQLNTLRERRGF
jgi:mannose/fructose/N-acetylgalactosamine-specific phosphotransferase system component IIC